MIVQYQGKQNGIPTTFTIRIIGNNLSKSSSNYQLDLLIGDKQIPTFTTLIHQSLSNCLKEIISEYVPYDLVLYNYQKNFLFMA